MAGTEIRIVSKRNADCQNGSRLVKGGGGGGGHSNLGCHDMFLKIVSLLKNYRSEWGKSIHFWKALCTGF